MRLAARGLAVAPPGADTPLLSAFDLDVDTGEWLAIDGPNGGGKTTLVLTLAGLWPARSGTVRLDGEGVAPDSPAARRGIATVLQEPATQLLQSTVADELAFAARNLGAGGPELAWRLRDAVSEFDLADDLGRDPRTLSAGRQQQVLLAAALVAAPRLLVADEPCAHMDSAARERSLRAVRARVERGLAVVWVSQHPGELAAADRRLRLGGAPESLAEPHARAAPEAAPRVRIHMTPAGAMAGPGLSLGSARSLTVPVRGVTGIVGANGTGKSVLLNALAGLISLPGVRFEWVEAARCPPLAVTQYPEQQLFGESVAEELAWASIARGTPPAEAERESRALLDRLSGAPIDPDRRPWTLSGGERRLLIVAAALSAPADVITLDEPTVGLDPARREALAAEVVRQAERRSIVIATQDEGWLNRVGGTAFRLGIQHASDAASPSGKTD